MNIPIFSEMKFYTKNPKYLVVFRVKSEKIGRNSFSFLFVLTFLEKRVIICKNNIRIISERNGHHYGIDYTPRGKRMRVESAVQLLFQ